MDHQPFAQLLGNYGEFIGAIAVVATLIYLASQIRQSNIQAEQMLTQIATSNQAIFAQQIAALINHCYLAAELAERGLIAEELYKKAT